MGPVRSYLKTGITVFLALCSLVLLGFFIQLGWTGYISDSAIWSVTLAKHISQEWANPWVFTRPLFYGLLGLGEAFASDAISIFLAAKVVSTGNGVLLVLLTFLLARRIRSPARATAGMVPWLAVIALLANTAFLNQGYRIRSDLFGSTLLLMVLERSLKMGSDLKKGSMWIWLTPLLATPKAVLQVLPLAVFVPSRKLFLWFLEIGLMLVAAIVLIYPRGLEYYFNAFFSHVFYLFTGVTQHFFYVERMVSGNHILVALLFLRGAAVWARLRWNLFDSPEQRNVQLRYSLYILFSLLIMILSPQKVPFFLAAYLPLFSVFIALICEDLWVLHGKMMEGMGRRERVYRWAYVLTLFFIVGTLVEKARRDWTYLLQENDSAEQFKAISILEKYLESYPGAVYYDVVGTIPQKATLRYFVGPDDPVTNRIAMDVIRERRPNFIFYINKCILLEPDLSHFLRDNYVTVGNGVYARWERFDKPLALRKKFRGELEKRLDWMAGELKIPAVEKFIALTEFPKQKPSWKETTMDGLDEVARTRKGGKLLAVAPYRIIEGSFGTLQWLIRFDSEF